MGRRKECTQNMHGIGQSSSRRKKKENNKMGEGGKRIDRLNVESGREGQHEVGTTGGKQFVESAVRAGTAHPPPLAKEMIMIVIVRHRDDP
ncbi:hypothetical protein niasHS_005406 [Heterodera schachtii]|uniref:Uncharacterized protein n=1 Tax=Heterodera schachtii TaxID=97005 RepID=A0ABD2J9C4_HETSC